MSTTAAATLEDRVSGDAHRTWELIKDEHRSGVPAMAHSAYGNGWIVTGSVSMAIRRTLGIRKGQQDTHVDLVRKFLSATRNVVTLDKVRDYEFNIFVSEEWRDHPSFPVMFRSGRRIHRLSPQELKTIREAEANPLPVTVITADDDKTDTEESSMAAPALTPVPSMEDDAQETEYPLSEMQAKCLLTLFQMGGTVESRNASRTLLDAVEEMYDEEVSWASINSLVDRGLIERKKSTPDAKRSKRLRITEAGRKICTTINAHRQTAYVLAEWLEAHGSYKGSSPSRTSDEIAGALGAPHNAARVMQALHGLEEKGVVQRTMSSAEGFLVGVRWTGEKDVPKVTEPITTEATKVEPPKVEPPKAEATKVEPAPTGVSGDEVEEALDVIRAAYAAAVAKAESVDASLEEKVGDLTIALEMIREAVQRQTDGNASVFETLGSIDGVLRQVGV